MRVTSERVSRRACVRIRATALERGLIVADTRDVVRLFRGRVAEPHHDAALHDGWFPRRGGTGHSLPAETGHVYEIAVAIQDGGTRFSVTVDGHLMQSHVDAGEPEHRFVASCVTDSVTGKTWLRVVNATDAEVAVDVTDERGRVVRGHEAVSLTAAATAGAPFVTAPTLPQALSLHEGLQVPARSVTVMEITAP
jgi:hypothetical protein